MNNIPQTRIPAFSAGAAHDAISTSSSTLVNPDLNDDDVVVRRRRHQHTHLRPVSNDRLNTQDGMKPSLFTSDGWLKSEAAMPSSSFRISPQPKKDYPDDHRCSDQETASGLCGCNRDASPESGSSSSPATVSEPEEESKRAIYNQQLQAARKRKLMMEKRSLSSDSVTVVRVETETSMRGSTSQSQYKNGDRFGRQSRDLQSDPVLVPRPASQLSFHSHDGILATNSHDEDWVADRGNRQWASSPIQPASRRLSSNVALVNTQRSQSVLAKSSSHSMPAPPSAARKSISSVFEKLLKEEEQRREDERAKKEAARERRRESKRRKGEEWPRSSEAKENVLLEKADTSERQAQHRDVDQGAERDNDGSSIVAGINSFASSSQLHQDATRLQRLSRKSALSSSIARIAPRPSPEKPAASSYKAKLAALRSASVEEKAAPFPVYRLNDPLSSPLHPKATSAINNQSFSDDSQASEGDQVTMGSDYQGRAPLQSTPPRNSPSTRSRALSESPTARLKSPDSSIVEDSLRQTVQQLTAVLQEVREIKGDAAEADQLPIVELSRANKQRELALQTVSNEGRKRITDIDEVYVQKLGQIRERLQGAKSRTPVDRIEKRKYSSWTRSVLVTLFVQFLFAWLMMTAAEVRARQLFLTTYYDPFLPHDLMDLSHAHTGSFFGPLLQKWTLFPVDRYFLEDNLILPNQTWTNTLSWAVQGFVHGPDRITTARLLSFKIFTLLGLDLNDTRHGSFVPT